MNKLIILSYAVLIVLFTGCKDFLQEKPKDFFETSNFYVDEASLKTGLFGIYERLNYTYCDVNMAFMGTLGTDESLPLYYGAEVAEMYKYTAKSDFIVYENYYNAMYEGIARANFIIETAPKVLGVEENVVNQIIEEAKALRAYMYFNLVQNFGPVALLEESMKTVDNKLPRSPIADVYNLIVRDLNEALNSGYLLAEKSVSEPGRLSQNTVRGILGKVYLTMASSKKAGVIDRLMNQVGKEGYGYGAIDKSVKELYTLASNTLEPLVSLYTLNDSYGEVFCNDNKNKIEENMWELQFIDNEPGGSSWKKRLGILWFPPTESENVPSNASGWTQVNYTPYLWSSYANGDSRKDWNLVNYILFKGNESVKNFFNPADAQINEAFYSWCGVVKYRVDADAGLVDKVQMTNYGNLPLNTTILRFADILLAYAEAELGANDGPTAEAVNAINRIRNRARKSSDDSLTPDFKNYTLSTLTEDAILNERLLELCFENLRWYDLTRTGKLVEKYNEPTIVGNYKQGAMDEHNYLKPIPQSQIDRSQNKDGFFQNPQY